MPGITVKDSKVTAEPTVIVFAIPAERVTDVVLRLDNIGGTGQTVLYDVGKALKKLQDSNKNIIAVGDYYTRSGYYLASFADEIIMNTDGVIEIDGFGRSRLFFKSFLDKLKVDFNSFNRFSTCA